MRRLLLSWLRLEQKRCRESTISGKPHDPGQDAYKCARLFLHYNKAVVAEVGNYSNEGQYRKKTKIWWINGRHSWNKWHGNKQRAIVVKYPILWPHNNQQRPNRRHAFVHSMLECLYLQFVLVQLHGKFACLDRVSHLNAGSSVSMQMPIRMRA